ncbi:hypothetical protein OSK30_26255, partial [Escherichia coli]|nr:hypothetical protein [Escherichia coli]
TCRLPCYLKLIKSGRRGRELLLAFYLALYPLIMLNNMRLFHSGRWGRGLLQKIIKTRRNRLL